MVEVEPRFWSQDDIDFPTDAELGEKLKFLIGFAALAPSSHNSQPWLFALGPDWIDIIADRRRALPVIDPMDRELSISCGAAAHFLEVAARKFGLQARTELLPDPHYLDHLVRMHVKPGRDPEPDELATFEAIRDRRTNRGDFDTAPVPTAVRGRCAALVGARGVDLHIFETSDEVSAIGALVAEADRRTFGDMRYRRELAAWIHASRSETRDGIPAGAFGMPHLLSPLGSFLVRTFDIGHLVAKVDEMRVITASPAIFLLSTTSDEPMAWVNTGRALAALLLHLTVHDLSASYLNQVIQVDELRTELSTMVGNRPTPQVLLRVGHARQTPMPTPRRPVSELIVT